MKEDKKIVRAILRHLEDETKKEPKLTESEWIEYLVLLEERGYVKARITKNLVGVPVGVNLMGITAAGRDYLAESTMKAVPFKIIEGLKGAFVLVLGVALDEVVRHCVSVLWK